MPKSPRRALGIVLTKRGKHLGHDIPMCGVPIERADEYLHRLIALGHRVAVCEQTRGPGRSAQARRQERGAPRCRAAGNARNADRRFAARGPAATTICWRSRARARRSDERPLCARLDRHLDRRIPRRRMRAGGLAAEIARIEPGEIIVSDALYADPELAPYLRSLPAVTPLTRDVFDGATAERRLARFFASPTTDVVRRILAARARRRRPPAVTYVERTQLGKRPPLSPPIARGGRRDARHRSRRRAANLELMRTLGGERRGSLLAAIDRTVTAAGSRLLAQRLAAPLTDPDAIAHRLDAVGAFVSDSAARARAARTPESGTRSCARACPLVLGRGGPRDLAAIRDGIFAAAAIAERDMARWANCRDDLARAVEALREPDGAIAAELDRRARRRAPRFEARRRLRARRLRPAPRRGARAARRIAPRHRRAAGALRRRRPAFAR